MTHEIFSQIASWLDDFDSMKCAEFLDGNDDSIIYNQLFDLYKVGKQREMFELIKDYNLNRLVTTSLDKGNIIRDDARTPRNQSNNNVSKLMKKRSNKNARA